jgi:biotin carboxyl carrier protein
VAQRMTVGIGSREYEVEVNDEIILVNGIPVALDSVALDERCGLSFRSGERLFRATFEQGLRESFTSFQGREFPIEFETARDVLLKQLVGRGGTDHHHAELKASMPGLVIRIKVRPGEEVAKGQPVIILEAMKMENEIRVPADGVIKELCVQEGQPVEKGDLLIVLD